jgi:DUF4097 and DUF4098 domain-containing protein YvlB
MERKRRIATWSGTVLGVALAVMLNVALAHGAEDLVTEEFHHTYPLAANGRVELSNINGNVHITAWDQNQVKVDAVKRAEDQESLKSMEIRIDSRADSLSIETKYHQNDENWSRSRHQGSEVEYTLTVPRNAQLDEIKLINGGLDVTGIKGEVRASCINGKLVANGLTSRVKLETINGPLEATFDQLQSAIELSSVNGPVRLTLPSDAKAHIEATTVHGGIDNNFGLHVNNHRWVGHDLAGELGSGGVEIRLRNVNGPVEIRHANDGRAVSPAHSSHGGDDDDSI